ncbi:hypothetical protein [Streptomyces sp. NPDC058620]|uniref:hypothetical protein n=1 Tax=Streptomyces sp. NPDC058620 TaxID=3346560 RepID=UPI003661385A
MRQETLRGRWRWTRQTGVKGPSIAVRTTSRWLSTGLGPGFAHLGRTADSIPHFNQELTMADLAFVVTTVAVFALVALIARGVTKL